MVDGTPDRIAEEGAALLLTCRVPRIKPEAAGFYWMVERTRLNGSITTTIDSDGTFSQSNLITLM